MRKLTIIYADAFIIIKKKILIFLPNNKDKTCLLHVYKPHL